MINSRAQAATELLIILAIIMIIFLVIVGISQKTSTSVKSQTINLQAKEFVNQLSHNAKLVHGQGIAAKTQVLVTLPSNVDSVTITNTTISLVYSYGGSTTTIYENLEFQVNGSLPNLVQGSFLLDIEAKDGYVQISSS